MGKKKPTRFSRYFTEALSAAGQGVFASLCLGIVLSFLADITGFGFLNVYGNLLNVGSPVIGAVVGVAVALAIDSDKYAAFTSAAVGALGYDLGGPIGAYIAVIAGAEVGNLISGRTKVDLILVPLFTFVIGGVVARLVGQPVSYVVGLLGRFINNMTAVNPIIMGIVIAVIMCLIITSPLSSVVMCVSLGLSGTAAGAATVGCCTAMLGLAVTSYWDNGLEGLFTIGLGSPKFLTGNIVRRPLIIGPEVITSAILGPISTTLVVITNTSVGAGMGSCGLMGIVSAYRTLASFEPMGLALFKVVIMLFVAPILLCFLFGLLMKKQAYIKKGEMILYKI